MSVPSSRRNAALSAVSSRNVIANVGGAITSPHSDPAPTRSSRWSGFASPIARANSLILPRSTVTGYGGYCLPISDLLISIAISESPPSARALLHRARQELLHIGHEEAFVPALGDLLLVVPRLDREQEALAVRFEQRSEEHTSELQSLRH